MAFATLAVCVSPYSGDGTPFEEWTLFHWLYCWVGNCQFVMLILSVFCLAVGVYRSKGTWSLLHHHPTSSALHVLVYICIVSTTLAVCDESTYFLLPHLSLSGIVGRVPEASRIFNTYPVLFRIL